MQGILIFFSCTIFMCGAFFVWPSRYNVTVFLNLGFVFLAYFIPAVILRDQEDFPEPLVSLYTTILVVGASSYLIGMYAGFVLKPLKTSFSFDVLSVEKYEARIVYITKVFITCGICGIVIGFIMMGYVPMFAADPLAAKFFRNQYQVPFYTSIIFRSSFYVLSTITPISLMCWWTDKKNVFLIVATMAAVGLMMLSLARGPAFTGILYALMIILCFKSRLSFVIAIVLLVVIYSSSSVFYYLIGVKDIASLANNFKDDHILWRVMSSGTTDIMEQLDFLDHFQDNPIWTYGRTIYGGLIPSPYEWNPSVYTLRVLIPGEDVTTLITGGVRLPAPIWGYVSFQWPGVILFCFLSGFIKGVIVRYLKTWILKYKSVLMASVFLMLSLYVFEQFTSFYLLSLYSIPPMFILSFYMYRINVK
jgi:oligosaccharide repeat unit polymerase